jgi:hypothetical protein
MGKRTRNLLFVLVLLILAIQSPVLELARGASTGASVGANIGGRSLAGGGAINVESPEKRYQVEGVVEDIASDFWVLQSEMGLFKFKTTLETENDLQKIKVGDRVGVTYRAEVIRIKNLTLDRRTEQNKKQRDEAPYEITDPTIVDDRAFYSAEIIQKINIICLAFELQNQQAANQLFLGG